MSGPRNPRSPLLLRYIDRLSELAGYASAVLILVSMLIVCYGVLLRYVFGASTVWQLELSTYFLMFSAFVGGAYGLKHGDHVNLSLIVDRLPEKPRLYVQLVASVLGFVFVVTVAAIASCPVVGDHPGGYDFGHRVERATDLPLSHRAAGHGGYRASIRGHSGPDPSADQNRRPPGE